MNKIVYPAIAFVFLLLTGCNTSGKSQTDSFWVPVVDRMPAHYWECTGVINAPYHNSTGQEELSTGLQYHLLAQSVQGLSFLAIGEKRGKTAVWLDDPARRPSYEVCKSALNIAGIHTLGKQDAVDLAVRSHKQGNLKEMWQGEDGLYNYVLSDVENNPESGNVATVASHVYNAIIVDVRDTAYFNSQGYMLRYDATQKSAADAWIEFKDRCNNKALVVMPVQTGELRSYAIAHRLFVLNLNKEYNNPAAGQNSELFDEVLEWLEPHSPVFGWEQGVGEDEFVIKVSQTGNLMVPYDWAYNSDFTALTYKKKKIEQAKSDNPRTYRYDEKGNYVSFYLSDGDNVQWMMNGFEGENYYSHPETDATKISFGLPVVNLSMLAPEQMNSLFRKQNSRVSVIENFGGGYYYIDQFGELKDRPVILKGIARKTAFHMQRSGCSILGVIAQDLRSEAAHEAYQAYVDANDRLEGIVAIQYTPYAGGAGEIFWITNKQGYDIPVVTVKYSLWNFGNHNTPREGTPAYIAGKLRQEADEETFSLISVHAWSRFRNTGNSTDEVAENEEGNQTGAGAAGLCMNHLGTDFRAVNVQELIWRIRMHYRPEQTKRYLQ